MDENNIRHQDDEAGEQPENNNEGHVELNEQSRVETTSPQTNDSRQIPAEEKADTKMRKLFSKQTWILLILFVFTLLLGAGGAAAFFMITDDEKETTSESTFSDEEETDTTYDAVEDEKIVAANPEYKNSVFNQQSKEVWLSSRKKIAKPEFLNSVEEFEDNAYYEVGSREGNTIIMHALFGLGETVNFYEVDSSGKATAMLNYNNQYNSEEDYHGTSLKETGITLDTETIYDSLTLPSGSFELENGFSLYGSRWGIQILDGPYEYSTSEDEFFKDTVQIQKTETGAFYSKPRTITYEDPIIELREVGFYYRTPVGTVLSLTYTPFGSKKVSDITFTRGTTHKSDTTGTYEPITRGCGFASAYTHYPKITDEDVTKVGTGNNNEDVYGLVDTNYKILTKYVEELASFTENKASKEELLDNNALIFFKNQLGEWEVYGSPYYTQFGGCAKPVVYLYPEVTTTIDVEVGATVKVSDPFYELNGWQNVVAEPSGYLHYQGKLYDSLFWEGPGFGQYPNITSGVIVKTTDAIPTIRTQMTQMGFNDREIDDFVEYWKDKLPTMPYTRLTWLQTAEMEALAPLSITPRPDSVLRAFLDFSGLENNRKIPAQTLHFVERNGFTVTEWGGLTPYRIY